MIISFLAVSPDWASRALNKTPPEKRFHLGRRFPVSLSLAFLCVDCVHEDGVAERVIYTSYLQSMQLELHENVTTIHRQQSHKGQELKYRLMTH